MIHYCQSDEHDGGQAPVTRRVFATISTSYNGRRYLEGLDRCSWCAEVMAARLLREGWTVTVKPVGQVSTDA